MKFFFWLALVVSLSTGLLAQTSTRPKSAPKRSNDALRSALNAAIEAQNAEQAGKQGGTEKEVQVVPGPATVAGDNVNVRGRASFAGEIVTRLAKGDAVTVLEKITLAKPGKDEPAQWARIAFPTNGHVWVAGAFIEPASKTVLPKTLNLRGGPGENYSVVGILQRGDVVSEIRTKDRWMEIVPPPGAYAFVAAQFLRQEAGTAPTAPAEPAPASLPTEAAVAVPATPPAIPAPIAATETTAPPAEPPAASTPLSAEPATPAPAEPPPKRIVQREGIVRPAWNVQSPTAYSLVSVDTGETINYLYTTSTNLNLKRYKGLKIIVTGEEGLDSRWTNTPVITIQRIHVVE